MPILAGILTSIFAGLTDFFVRWVSKKTAFGLAAVSVFLGLTTAMFAAIGVLLNALVVPALSDIGFLIGLWVAFPPNAQMLISATVAADTAVALYRWNVENMRLIAYVT